MSLFESAMAYLTESLKWPAEEARDLIMQDYRATGKIDWPKFLRVGSDLPEKEATSIASKSNLPKRQQRHLGKLETQNS